MKKIVIWGAGGHAMVVADIIRSGHEYEIAGFLDDLNELRKNELFCGSTILGGKDQLKDLRTRGIEYIIIAFGNSSARLRAADLALEAKFKLAIVLHPRSIIASDVKIGDGTVVTAGAVINSMSTIGQNVIVNTSSSIDHECTLGDGVHICPGVHLAGKVSVGKGTWVGMGSIVKEGTRIGEHSLIGAGSLILNEVPAGTLAYGSPAKLIRKLNKDEY